MGSNLLAIGANGQLIGAGGIIEVRPPSLAEMLNRSTSVEHLSFSPDCANEMLAAVFKVMAKRYYSYEDLKDVSGKFKLGGTLGSHFCTVTPMPYCIWVTPMDADTGGVFLKPGDTLGYDCGNVWRLPNPANVKDPLRRAMLTHKIGKDRLHWISSPDELPSFDVDTYQREGCVAFFNGEQVAAECEFGVITKQYIFKRPIDQIIRWGNVYVLVGTPRKKVAEFINNTFNGVPSPGNRHAMAFLSAVGGTYHEIK